jgi:hypothetical protein
MQSIARARFDHHGARTVSHRSCDDAGYFRIPGCVPPKGSARVELNFTRAADSAHHHAGAGIVDVAANTESLAGTGKDRIVSCTFQDRLAWVQKNAPKTRCTAPFMAA